MRRAIPLMLMLLLAGCGGGGAGTHAVPQTAATPSGAAATSAKTVAGFTITIPAASAQEHARDPQYVSTATQSVIITLTSVNGSPFTGAQAETAANLNPSNAACSGSPLTCTILAPAVPGTDVFTVSTYSAQQTSSTPAAPAGSLLSTATISVTVVAGQANMPPTPLVLNGVATSITASLPNDQHITGSATAGYSIAGMQTYPLTVTAQDASGETIVGDGAPSFTAASSSGAVAISPSTANTFAVHVKSFSQTPVTLTVTPSTGSSSNVTLTTVQELWVAERSADLVEAFALTSPPTQMTEDSINVSTPEDVAIDANGILWIPTYAANTVEAFAPGTNAPISADTLSGLNVAVAAKFDTSGNLWIACSGSNAVYAYAPGSPPSRITGDTITGLNNPQALAISASNQVWVANYDSNTVEAFTPGSNSPIAADTITNDVNDMQGMAFDSTGDLWISNFYPAAVNAFQPGTNAALAGDELSNSLLYPFGLAFDATGHLWIANSGLKSLVQFSPGTNVPITANTISTRGTPLGIAIAQ